MNRIGIVLLALFFGVCAGLFALGVPEEEAVKPGIIFSSTSWEFGTIRSSEAVSFELTVRNTDSGTYTVTLMSTCGCVTVTPVSGVLGPGESRVFTLAFDPSSEEGEVEKAVIVRSTHPDLPKAIFSILGTVVPAGTGKNVNGL